MADAEKGAAWLDARRAGRVAPSALDAALDHAYVHGIPPGERTGWPELDELYTVAEESRASHVAVLEKTSGVEVPAPLTLPADIGRRLDDVDSPKALTEWSAQAAELLSDGRRILAANRAPIQERTELRGLLDAYHAKARALRALEDPELSKRFERAHRALHTAPTDLREAARLVHDYRRGLGAPGVRR